MDQAEFNFSGRSGGQGFVEWRKERQVQTQELRAEHGLPVNSRVRLKLRDFAQVFEGWLMLAPKPSKTGEHRFQLASLAFDFGLTEVEWCLAAKPDDE